MLIRPIHCVTLAWLNSLSILANKHLGMLIRHTSCSSNACTRTNKNGIHKSLQEMLLYKTMHFPKTCRVIKQLWPLIKAYKRCDLIIVIQLYISPKICAVSLSGKNSMLYPLTKAYNRSDLINAIQLYTSPKHVQLSGSKNIQEMWIYKCYKTFQFP